jgi:predicted flap endonuclease-1-like 5' DNA nuclease
MANVVDIEGIGPAHGAKLEAAGIKTEDQLLKTGAAKKGREEIAQKTGISESLILKWVNRADLARIKGVGGQFADLLEHAGVDSVPELAQRNAESLHAKLSEINGAKNLTNRLPSAGDVADWIAQAKSLDRMVTH